GAPSGSGGMSGSEAQQALDELQKYLAEENLADEVVLKREDRGLVVSLSEAGFFEPGKAQLKPGSDAMLDRIARMVKRMNRPIQIDGHTDNTPIRYSAFRSNLELSIARAAETYGALVERYGLEPAHIGAAGWGEWRPIASNDTPEGRARNRRVDIVILGSDLPSVLPAPTP
ncbi:MAG: flagellar motor protein MotB, partial [Candidatus Sumerlaeota bacterium]|nr:flagellar motor protein MotB [Candidatus Sumerlaeota bacterium]